MRYSNVVGGANPEVGDKVDVVIKYDIPAYTGYEVVNVYTHGLLLTKHGSNDNTVVIDYDEVQSINYCGKS